MVTSNRAPLLDVRTTRLGISAVSGEVSTMDTCDLMPPTNDGLTAAMSAIQRSEREGHSERAGGT